MHPPSKHPPSISPSSPLSPSPRLSAPRSPLRPPCTEPIPFLPSLLALLTLIALLIGTAYYWDQLSRTPFYLLVFVPDCPLYALLGSLLLLIDFPKSPAWRFLVACGLVIYGTWTISVILTNAVYFSTPDIAIQSLVLLIGHSGMVLQGLLVLPRPALKGAHVLFATFAWFALNTFIDYRIGPLSTHPAVPSQTLGFIEPFTWGAIFVFPTLLFALGGKIVNNKSLSHLRDSLSWKNIQ